MSSSINEQFDNLVYSFDVLPAVKKIEYEIACLNLNVACTLLHEMRKQLEHEKEDYERAQIKTFEYKHLNIPF